MTASKTSNKDEPKLFKDWFDPGAAKALAEQMRRADANFPAKKFVRIASSNLAPLEFAGRVKQFSEALASCLPQDTPRALALLRASFPEPLPDCEAVTDGWLQWPIGQYIADHGLDEFDESMLTMIELTQRFSAEFAVRPFVEHRQGETISYLKKLTDHESPHVRRWCSEGLRTRLPWGKKLNELIANPKPVLPVLEALKDDAEIYVRRSVANNLNDIAKDHPDLVKARCKRWFQSSKAHRVSLVKHAMRTLIKDGDTEALNIIGFSAPKRLRASLTASNASPRIGESVTLLATLESDEIKPQPILIDYLVHYVRKNGSTSGKVFKWKQLELHKGQRVELQKKHSFKTTTVRALYPGAHRVELQVNGVRVASTEVRLVAESRK